MLLAKLRVTINKFNLIISLNIIDQLYTPDLYFIHELKKRGNIQAWI